MSERPRALPWYIFALFLESPLLIPLLVAHASVAEEKSLEDPGSPSSASVPPPLWTLPPAISDFLKALALLCFVIGTGILIYNTVVPPKILQGSKSQVKRKIEAPKGEAQAQGENTPAEASSLHEASPVRYETEAEEVARRLKSAQEAYDHVRDDFVAKQEDLDWQLDHPDLFRVSFPPAAAFFQQFEDTKAYASKVQDRLKKRQFLTLDFAKAFEASAEDSVSLWETAVEEASNNSLTALERAKVGRVRKLRDQARDPATQEAHAANLMAAAARILADLNLHHMEASSRKALESITSHYLALEASQPKPMLP